MASPPGKPKQAKDENSSLNQEDLYYRKDPSASQSQLTAALSTMDSISIHQDKMETTMNSKFGTLEGQLAELLSLVKAKQNNDGTGESHEYPPGGQK
jgi:hypothetical protein